MAKDGSTTPKFFSLTGSLIIAMGISCIIFGAIIGTVTTYLLLDVNDSGEDEQGFAAGESEFRALVTEVIDGDTIEVELNGKPRRVRYLGIDAPENKGEDVVYYGVEALEKNRQLVHGKEVRMICDANYQTPYGRIMAYVYVDDLFVNAEMIKGGYATIYRRSASPESPKHRYYDHFKVLQDQALAEKRGIWDTEKRRKWEQEHGIASPLPSLHPIKYVTSYTDPCFHRPDCPTVENWAKMEKKIIPIYYYDRDEAICEQKKPCSVCKP